jgi:HD domain
VPDSRLNLLTLLRSLEAVLEWQGDKADKANDPAVGHLLQVAGLAIKYRPNDTVVAVAALLHDVLEDVPEIGEEALISRFGPEVAEIVHECSDSVGGPRDSSDWCKRKLEYLSRLQLKSDRARFVSLCDKVANARALELDLEVTTSPKVFFESFNQTDPAGQLWYYSSLADLFDRYPPERSQRLVAELKRAVKAMHDRLGIDPAPCLETTRERGGTTRKRLA